MSEVTENPTTAFVISQKPWRQCQAVDDHITWWVSPIPSAAVDRALLVARPCAGGFPSLSHETLMAAASGSWWWTPRPFDPQLSPKAECSGEQDTEYSPRIQDWTADMSAYKFTSNMKQNEKIQLFRMAESTWKCYCMTNPCNALLKGEKKLLKKALGSGKARYEKLPY